jgi:flavin reductase (DIM6/NTAB) family NADH-FMN oxidoreductase RutF
LAQGSFVELRVTVAPLLGHGVGEAGVFNQLVGQLDYPMLIVTTALGEDRAGCLVGFHTQCSIDPPRFLVCISRRNHTFALAARSDMLAVHFLDESNYGLASLFGEQTGDSTDKFAACSWRAQRGLPLLIDAPAWLIGRVLRRTEFGDHTGYLLEPIEAAVDGVLHQLAYQRVKSLKPGHPA